jgi:hypothetical protein
VNTDNKPVDIVRWPNAEHRFSSDSPLHVGLTKPVNIGFSESPVNIGFTDKAANVNMNIVTPNAVGVNLLGSSEPVALRLVITEPIVAKSDYSIQLKINGNEVFSVSVAGTTTLFTQSK